MLALGANVRDVRPEELHEVRFCAQRSGDSSRRRRQMAPTTSRNWPMKPSGVAQFSEPDPAAGPDDSKELGRDAL